MGNSFSSGSDKNPLRDPDPDICNLTAHTKPEGARCTREKVNAGPNGTVQAFNHQVQVFNKGLILAALLVAYYFGKHVGASGSDPVESFQDNMNITISMADNKRSIIKNCLLPLTIDIIHLPFFLALKLIEAFKSLIQLPQVASYMEDLKGNFLAASLQVAGLFFAVNSIYWIFEFYFWRVWERMHR